MSRQVLVTGGKGFIGSALVKALLDDGCTVRVFDDNSRAATRWPAEIAREVDFVAGDIRDAAAVSAAAEGVDELCHLAFVNGTPRFYAVPELVLDVGVKGIVNVVDACRAKGVGTLVVASSSEVYQNPPVIPTDETAPLSLPDPYNPRLSYAAGKIISEIMAINYGRKYFERVLIFRPHNVYGPDMGADHVIPQFAIRLKHLVRQHPSGPLPFEVRGDPSQVRSFCYIDDLVRGVMLMRARGEHLGIYHIGNDEETAIGDLAAKMAACVGRQIAIMHAPEFAGSPVRRCPDISKMRKLGYAPRVPLMEGLRATLDWYWAHGDAAPADGGKTP